MIRRFTQLHVVHHTGWWRAFRIVVLLSLLLAGLPGSSQQVPVAQAATLTWQFVNSMNDARCCFTATLLNNGQVFVVGGNGASGSAIALTERYDDVHNTWIKQAPMAEARQQHSATLLPDGRLLVAGGVINNDTTTVKATAEIYNPATNTWSPTGSLHTARANHFAVLLPNGRVLIGGGYTTDKTIDSAELYNPASGTWTVVANIPWSAQQETATLLNDGTVLVTGGDGTANAALYNPASNSWQTIASMHSNRAAHSATLLHDGRVLITGFFATQADIYNPTTRTWSQSEAASTARFGDTAALLPNGQVLVSGGRTTWTGSVVDSTEIFNPDTNEWLLGPRMNQTLEDHQSIMLPNNYLLVIGGAQNGAVFDKVEQYGPIDASLGCTPSSVVILENDSCQLALHFRTLNVNSTSFSTTVTSADQSLIPNANLLVQGTGSERSLTITPAKTNAQTAPTHRGTTIVSIQANDGVRSETLQYQVHVVPPPWLVMLYLNGDDGPLDGNLDLNAPNFASIAPAIHRLLLQKLPEMPYNPAMRLVVVADLHDSNDDSRVYVRDPDQLTDVTAQLSADQSRWPGFKSELNTADPSTVRAFVNWARNTYPDSTYSFLSLVDHGGGWAPDLNGSDGQPRGVRVSEAGGWRGMSVDFTGDGSTPATAGQSMSTKDTHRALEGLGINVVFFDACFMGMLESAYEIRNDADYLIAGENELFAEFPYDAYFSTTQLKANTPPQDVATNIVTLYNATVNKQKNPFAIAAIDLHQLRAGSVSNLPQRVDTLATQILGALPAGSAAIPANNTLLQAILQAYAAAQKYDYDSDLILRTDREGYVDLQDFVTYLRSSTTLPDNIRTAAQNVETVIRATGSPSVLAIQPIQGGTYNGRPMDLAHSNGLSIYLPLGEQDHRPTRVDLTKPGCPASAEPQLPYYNDPAQLAFRSDYPHWAALLIRLQNNVPIIRAPIPAGCPVVQALAHTAGVTIDTRPFVSPSQLSLVERKAYLPLAARAR